MTNSFYPAITLVLCMVLNASPSAAEPIQLQSNDTPTALVELYTSEGCSSCPPADKWLSHLRNDPTLWSEVVPLAFHVDYWDYIGWKDRFANPANSDRQREYRQAGLIKSVYTPEFIVAGHEWRGWFRGNSLPTKQIQNQGQLNLVIENEEIFANYITDASGDRGFELHLALLGCDLKTIVEAGENHGRTLSHDFVVLKHQTTRLDLPKNTQTTGHHTVTNVPTSGIDAPKLALAAWITEPGKHLPIQVVGGWLP